MLDPDAPVIIELLDENGEVIQRWEGPSLNQRWEAHLKCTCTWDCGFCYQEACDFLETRGS